MRAILGHWKRDIGEFLYRMKERCFQEGDERYRSFEYAGVNHCGPSTRDEGDWHAKYCNIFTLREFSAWNDIV